MSATDTAKWLEHRTYSGVAVFYRAGEWTALVECKPPRRPFRLLRGYGFTPEEALEHARRELEKFRDGFRDGEQ